MQLRQFGLALSSCLCLCAALPVFAVSFAPPQTLNSNAESDSFDSDQYADVAVGANGTWIAVWKRGVPSYLSAGDIHFARSTNNGTSWSTLEKIGGQDVDNDDTNPRVATDGAGNWVCVWQSGVSEADIFVSYSTNDGVSWSNEAYLNTSMETDTGVQDFTPSIATDGEGNWIVVWQSGASAGMGDGSDSDIFFAKSTNIGVSWSAMAPLNSNALTDGTNDDFTPDVKSDGADTWVCVWRYNGVFGQGDEADADLLVSRSTNDGGAWSAAAHLNATAATDYAGQEFNPRLANDESGNWVAVWDGYDQPQGSANDDYDIYSARSGDNGATWSAPAKVVSEAGVQTGPSDATPCIGTDANGTWICAWRRSGTDFDIYQSQSNDDGATWSNRTALHSNAASDTGEDYAPAVAANADGDWIVAWDSTEALDGDMNVDYDVLFVMSTDGPVGTLTLTNPNGGGKWRIGKRHRIEWMSTGNPGPNVKLELLKNGNPVKTIKGSTADDGLQKWKVPNDVPTGSGYKVRIKSVNDPSIGDQSDSPFRIKPAN